MLKWIWFMISSSCARLSTLSTFRTHTLSFITKCWLIFGVSTKISCFTISSLDLRCSASSSPRDPLKLREATVSWGGMQCTIESHSDHLIRVGDDYLYASWIIFPGQPKVLQCVSLPLIHLTVLCCCNGIILTLNLNSRILFILSAILFSLGLFLLCLLFSFYFSSL